MGYYEVQIALGMDTGLEEDRVVNTWHTITPTAPNAVDAQQQVFPFASFYQGIGGLMPSGLVSSLTAAHKIKVYGLTANASGAGDDDRILLVEDFFTTAALETANPAMPTEVAVCLSMASSPEDAPEFSGINRPRSRRRGRVFLGPWAANGGSTVVVSGGTVRVGPTLRTVILNYAEGLVDGLAALTAPTQLGVYSRKDAIARPISELSVDDAFDTVRSRGPKASLREQRLV